MSIKELIASIEEKYKEYGVTINPPASALEIARLEAASGIPLPADFREFYGVCNGFECLDYIFRMLPIEDILEELSQYGHRYGKNCFPFAEYIIYSDWWSLRKTETHNYEIFNTGEEEFILTVSLQEFLARYLQGKVFEEGGLYEWHEELKPKLKL